MSRENVEYMHHQMLSYVNFCPKEVRFKLPAHLEREERLVRDVRELKRNDYEAVEEVQSFVITEDTGIAKKMTEGKVIQPSIGDTSGRINATKTRFFDYFYNHLM